MKVSGLGPWVQTSPIEPSAAEKEQSIHSQKTAAQPAQGSAPRTGEEARQEVAQGFVRFVDFVKKLKKGPPQGGKEDSEKKRRRQHAARAYKHATRIEETLSQVGQMIDKKK